MFCSLLSIMLYSARGDVKYSNSRLKRYNIALLFIYLYMDRISRGWLVFCSRVYIRARCK